VKRQYIGNLGKTENGIVVVTAYGVFSGMTFPLLFEVYKPKERLKPGEQYHTKPEIAAMLMRKLESMGFKLVLADSLYGEWYKFHICIRWIKFKLYSGDSLKSFRRATSRQRIQYLKWHKRVFSDLTREYRFIREIIPGKRGEKRYWQITTDTVALPDHSTWYVMSRYPDITSREVGNFTV